MIQLGSDERVLHEIRHHWFVFLTESFVLVILFFIPWILFFAVSTFGFSFTNAGGALSIFVTFAWLFLLWIFLFIKWTGYYLDVWIVTDKRIIDVEQFNLFSRDVSEFRMDRVQDVTVEVKGIIPTLLHFGDVNVETAGESRQFTIRKVPEPYRVKDMIVEAHNKAVAHGYVQPGH